MDDQQRAAWTGQEGPWPDDEPARRPRRTVRTVIALVLVLMLVAPPLAMWFSRGSEAPLGPQAARICSGWAREQVGDPEADIGVDEAQELGDDRWLVTGNARVEGPDGRGVTRTWSCQVRIDTARGVAEGGITWGRTITA